VAKPKETLTSIFSPPDDLQGIGAVLCAYSADAEFLEQALFRFSRVQAASRRSRGSVDWCLMLDPTHPIIEQDVVPGVMHLRPKAKATRPSNFLSMHAKVALLAFGPARKGNPIIYRVCVSTGNWTYASARSQIEMAWFLDIDTRDASDSDRKELWLIATFLKQLTTCYQGNSGHTLRTDLLLKSSLEAGLEPQDLNGVQFLTTLSPTGNASNESLMKQLSFRLQDQIKDCNYIVCGSGFFEQLGNPLDSSDVLSTIQQQLTGEKVLTKSCAKSVVTNGDKTDQVMAAFINDKLNGWKLCHPKDPFASK
jgi:hypothetical protein